jgi:hypothetical protein
MRTTSKNKRNYNKKIGRTSFKGTVDVDGSDGMQEGNEEEFSDSDEEVTSSAGKRKKVQGGTGTSKKART